MDILEEEKLKEIKEKFSKLDFQAPDFSEKVEEIVGETLINNLDKVGELTRAETIDEHMNRTRECFGELSNLQKDGVLDQIEDEELKKALKEQATVGIEDEEQEKESIEKAGLVSDEMKQLTPGDLVEEILKQLEKAIEEKKVAIDKKIKENEAMLSKVFKREQLRTSRTKVNNLHEKTKELKGIAGKQLNENVASAITDLDKQIEQLRAETMRDNVELTEAGLLKENEELEEEKKSLEDMLQKIKQSYKEKDSQKIKLVLIGKQIDDIMANITPNMEPEELCERAKDLTEIVESDENTKDIKKEIKRMLIQKKIVIPQKVDDKEAEEKTVTLMDIVNVLSIDDEREAYENLIKSGQKVDEDEKDRIKKRFESGKNALELICGEEVLPLLQTEEYIKEVVGKQIDDILAEVTPNMDSEELSQKAKDLMRIVLKDEYTEEMKKEIRKMFAQKEVVINPESKKGTLTAKDIINTLVINDAREEYMKKTKSEQKADEAEINYIKGTFKSGKEALELICGEEILPLQTEEEYIKEFKGLEKKASKGSLIGESRVANEISKRMQKIYSTIAPFIENIQSEDIRAAYSKVARKLSRNKAISEKDCPPATLPEIKVEKKSKTDFVQKVKGVAVKTPVIKGSTSINMEKINSSLEDFAEKIVEGKEEDEGHEGH